MPIVSAKKLRSKLEKTLLRRRRVRRIRLFVKAYRRTEQAGTTTAHDVVSLKRRFGLTRGDELYLRFNRAHLRV